jgi:hypothetical protein
MSYISKETRQKDKIQRRILTRLNIIENYNNIQKMMWASPTRQMVALRPRHGGKAAMILASRGRHPGSARMMVASRPCHGEAMIFFGK